MGRRGDRGAGKKSKAKAKRKHPTPPETISTPFGKLEIHRVFGEHNNGRSMHLPALQPRALAKLPDGALPGNPFKQNFGYGGPQLYYVDEEMHCEVCNEEFTFWAKEKRFWYEELSFLADSRPRACIPCRKEKRHEEALRRAQQDAVEAAKLRPEHAKAQLELARSTCALLERALGGNADRAIGAARRARKLDPAAHEALHLEGRLQSLAGRAERAREAMQAFLDATATQPQRSTKTLRKQAEAFLARPGLSQDLLA